MLFHHKNRRSHSFRTRMESQRSIARKSVVRRAIRWLVPRAVGFVCGFTVVCMAMAVPNPTQDLIDLIVWTGLFGGLLGAIVMGDLAAN